MIIFWILIVLTAIYKVLVWVFEPEKCPKCGSSMYSYFDEEKNDFYYECPKCGHKEKYEERMNKSNNLKE
jgi:DNA-directed RNA polymerase subunit RPC12/RpoP